MMSAALFDLSCDKPRLEMNRLKGIGKIMELDVTLKVQQGANSLMPNLTKECEKKIKKYEENLKTESILNIWDLGSC